MDISFRIGFQVFKQSCRPDRGSVEVAIEGCVVQQEPDIVVLGVQLSRHLVDVVHHVVHLGQCGREVELLEAVGECYDVLSGAAEGLCHGGHFFLQQVVQVAGALAEGGRQHSGVDEDGLDIAVADDGVQGRQQRIHFSHSLFQLGHQFCCACHQSVVSLRGNGVAGGETLHGAVAHHQIQRATTQHCFVQEDSIDK